jgi:hypothetical protein
MAVTFVEVYDAAIAAGLTPAAAQVTAAQAMLETGWGKSVKGNNIFGVKAGSSWTGELSAVPPAVIAAPGRSRIYRYPRRRPNVNINVGAGTWGAATLDILNTPVGAPSGYRIIGDTTTPANVLFSKANGSFFNVGPWGSLYLSGIRMTLTAPNYSAFATVSGELIFDRCDFGPCTTNGWHVLMNVGGRVNFQTAITISGGALAHVLGPGSVQWAYGMTVTVTGTPAFGDALIQAEGAGIRQLAGIVWSGAATGKRYSAILNGVINTSGGGASFIPGSVAGTTATGGQYG